GGSLGVVREVGGQGLGDESVDGGGGCVEGARVAASVGGHEAFEHAAEHFGVDADVVCIVEQVVRGIAGCEPVALEELVEELEDRRIGQVDVGEASFERVRLEESAVEVWQAAEGVCLGGPVFGSCVERAEEEWNREVAVEGPSRV